MNEYTELNQPLQTSEIFSNIPPEITIPFSTSPHSGKISPLDTKIRGRLIYLITFFVFATPILVILFQLYSKYSKIKDTNLQIKNTTASLNSLQDINNKQKETFSIYNKENLEITQFLENKKIENVTNNYKIINLKDKIEKLNEEITNLSFEKNLLVDTYVSLLKEAKLG